MKPVPLEHVNVTDPQAVLLRDRIKKYTMQTDSCDLLMGNLIVGVKLTTGGAAVPHKLGHIPQGWMLAGSSAALAIGEYKDSDATNLYLKATGNVTVNLWVF